MTDAEIIAALGGATEVARQLGVNRSTVSMWPKRGIPAEYAVKIWWLADQRELKWYPQGAEGLRLVKDEAT